MKEATVKERPILFSGPMALAILEGRKTQTRRVITPQPVLTKEEAEVCSEAWGAGFIVVPCPYGKIGDRLWVRENWNLTRDLTADEQIKQTAILERFRAGEVRDIVAEAMELPMGTGDKRAMYAADFGAWAYDPDSDLHWKPSIHMPRWASRITLEITDVRVQRVQEISEDDAKAEGVGKSRCGHAGYVEPACSYRTGFVRTWDSINIKRGFGWNVNPWVWAISFRRVDA